jgi:hypothetical protein
MDKSKGETIETYFCRVYREFGIDLLLAMRNKESAEADELIDWMPDQVRHDETCGVRQNDGELRVRGKE